MSMKAQDDNPSTREEMAREQETMRKRMLTAEGHILIQIARCCISEPENLERSFPDLDNDVGPIMKNLDSQVLALIADTPIIIE